MKQKIRIILPGGGTKGIFQLGFLKTILDTGKYEIDMVYGTSVGALLSPFIICDKLSEVENIFSNIKSVNDMFEKRKIFNIEIPDNKLIDLFLVLFGLGKYKKLKLVDEIEKRLTRDDIEKAGEKCKVVAYDIINKKEKWFTGPELVDGIRCSANLWGALPPIKYKGETYIDGGVTELFPLSCIENDGFRGKYIMVDLDPRDKRPASTFSNGISLFNALHWEACLDLAELELKNKMEELGDNMVLIRPDKLFIKNSLAIDLEAMKKTYEYGVKYAEKFLEKN